MTYYGVSRYIPYDPWFHDRPHNPLDDMPIATDNTDPEVKCYIDEDEVDCESWEPKTYASRHESTPDHEKGAEEVVTMHEKMYRMATARYNPFSIGGSENCHADIDCPTGIGGSENAFKFQGGSEQAHK